MIIKITFINSQHENTNSKSNFLLKTRFLTFVLMISGKKHKNLSKKYIFVISYLDGLIEYYLISRSAKILIPYPLS